MTSNEIIKLLSECEFDGKLYSEAIGEKIFSHLPEDFEYDYNEGASKLVIEPYDEDYVIKIPYNGQYYSSSKKFKSFLCANTSDKYFWDYCMTETLVWRMAKAENVHKAFAKERMIGMVNGHPIYVQQKAEVFTDSDSYYSDDESKREKTLDYCEQEGLSPFYDEGLIWQADALEYYGPTQFNKIMSFIEDNNIGDFHNGNLGYIKNKPVFLDYSGFDS